MDESLKSLALEGFDQYKKQLQESIKNEKVYIKVLEAFPDAELIDIEVNTKQNDNDWF